MVVHTSDPSATPAMLVSTNPNPTAAQEITIHLHPGDQIPTSAQEISILLHPSDQIPTAAQAIPIDKDVLRQAYNKVQADHSKALYKIHRFPASLRVFCEERHYIAPMAVAIGPYHHGLPELQEMEEVKKAAAYHLCSHLGQSPEAVYEKVLAVAGDARSCYDSSALDGVSDADFASMMFYDACFLLVTIAAFTKSSWCAPSLLHRITTRVVATDVFLLENQIPWLVLEVLITFQIVDLSLFIATMGMNVQSRIDRHERPLVIGSYRPPHLLALFHFYQSGCVEDLSDEDQQKPNSADSDDSHGHLNTIQAQSATGVIESFFKEQLKRLFIFIIIQIARVKYLFLKIVRACRSWQSEELVESDPEIAHLASFLKGDPEIAHLASFLKARKRARRRQKLESLPLGTSAIELAEIGVQLTPSKTAELKDTGLITKAPIFPKLYMPPLNLNKLTASWLLNMAALETCTLDLCKSDYNVNSYLAFFAVLMDREEDVQELRSKHLVIGGFNNQEMLDFFKGRAGAILIRGRNYRRIIRDLQKYKKKRRMWIAIHRFVYHNVKTIVTVLSIVSVLVAIFKTLLSLKQQYRTQ